MKFSPLGDVLMIEPEERKSALVMPDKPAGEIGAHFSGLATVKAVGPGKEHYSVSTGQFVREPMPFKPGDRILCYLHERNFFDPFQKPVWMISASQVIAVVSDPEQN